MCSCMIETSVLPRKSSEILGYVRKQLSGLRTTSGIFGNSESVGNLWKIVKKVVIDMIDLQNNTWLLVNMDFLFSC